MEKISLTIEARREGYSLEQCGWTMTVGELKEILERYPDETKIYISNDRGYTYGPIRPNDINEKEEEEE